LLPQTILRDFRRRHCSIAEIPGEGAPRVTPSRMTHNHMRDARIDLLFTMSDNTRASGQSRPTRELVSHERARL